MYKLLFSLTGLLLLFSCVITPKQRSGDTRTILPGDMPETKRVENVAGKGLEDYATLEIKPEVFFETKAKIRSALLVDDGKLFFGNEDNEFYAIDIQTKQALWMYSTAEPVQTWPVITDGKILFNAGNSLYILSVADGKEIHKVTYATDRSFRLSQEGFAFNDSYVAVSDGVAYYAALNGDIVAVDIEKGEIIWSLVTPAYTSMPVWFVDTNNGKMTWSVLSEKLGAVASGVNFWDGKLYYTDYAGSLCCVDIHTRRLLFQTQLQDRIFAPLYITDGKIYAGGRSCKIYCVDADNGDVLWSSFSHDPTTWFSGGSVSIGNTLYTCTSDEHTLLAFDKDTGEFLRMYPTETNAYTAPLLHGEHIILAATDAYLQLNKSYIMAFDTKNHTKRWQASLNDYILSSPAIYRGVAYFGTDSGIIYALDTASY
jgi:outer membrane protein assembly factor BamB